MLAIFFFSFFYLCLCVFLVEKITTQVTINFNKLLVTSWSDIGYSKQEEMCKWSSLQGHDPSLLNLNCQIQSLPLGLERASCSTPKANGPLTKKAVKNLKLNKYRNDKCCAKSNTLKQALSSALELASKLYP